MPENQVVVFDTNVLIPMMLSASLSARLFSRLDAAGWELAATPQLFAEVANKLRTKESLRKWLDVSDGEIEEFIDVRLVNLVTMKPGFRQAHGAVPADPDDDMIIAAALESKAAYTVSEDKHLLDLGEYQGIKIMNRVDFAAELDRLGVA